MPSRRQFIAGFAATPLATSIGWSAVGSPVALSAARSASGSYVLVGLDAAGDVAFAQVLPARGHAGAAHPVRAEAVIIARRPGTYAIILDCASGEIRQTIVAPAGQHFFGHGAFSAEGDLLFTTENQIDTGAGRIGVWDTKLNYQRIDEFSSGGIGPHEILRLPSGDLAVANGGIRTNPATGRKKLNLDTMRPNLSLFGIDGRLKDQAEGAPAAHQNSLRHIAASPDGTIICGFQWQGDPYDAPPLVAFYSGKGRFEHAELDEILSRDLDGYIGSVCAMTDTAFAASSPRGGRVLTLDRVGRVTAVSSAPDCCGLATLSKGACLVTTGLGEVFEFTDRRLQIQSRHRMSFDNHVLSLIENPV
ncbi:MAG: DUF1513 domain-containing protein [Pseudomonadota bacterium]